MFTIHNTFWRGEYLQKGGHYILFPLSQQFTAYLCFPPSYIFPFKGGWLLLAIWEKHCSPSPWELPHCCFPLPPCPLDLPGRCGSPRQNLPRVLLCLNFLFLPTHRGSQSMHCAADCTSGEAQKQRRHQAGQGEWQPPGSRQRPLPVCSLDRQAKPSPGWS